jgi:hypothetical protein
MRRKLVMMNPQLAELPNDSLRVAWLFYKLRPTWIGYAGVGEWKGFFHLKIVIPSPISGRSLMIYENEANGPTVWFGGWHRHTYPYDGIKPAVQRAVDIAELIMAEGLVVACTESREFHRMGSYLPEDIAKIPVGELVYTCSWAGTYDRQYRPFDPTIWGFALT